MISTVNKSQNLSYHTGTEFFKGGSVQTEESSDKTLHTVDSIDLSEDNDEQPNSSVVNLPWLIDGAQVGNNPSQPMYVYNDQSGYDSVTTDSTDTQNNSTEATNNGSVENLSGDDTGFIARESAFGPNNEESIWVDPAKFRLPEDKTLSKNRKIVSDTLRKGLKSLHESEIKRQRKELYNDNILNIGKLWWDCIYCGNWKNTFANTSKNTNAGLNVQSTEKAAELTNALNKELKSQGIEVLDITPYVQKLPNENFTDAAGHEYVYLKVSIKGEEDLWMFTETNASKNPKKLQGNIRYQAYPVKSPDFVIISNGIVR
ncbi:MAG: hypothetical protein AB9903_20605 [Vulcanimicrobiota bacterium]